MEDSKFQGEHRTREAQKYSHPGRPFSDIRSLVEYAGHRGPSQHGFYQDYEYDKLGGDYSDTQQPFQDPE